MTMPVSPGANEPTAAIAPASRFTRRDRVRSQVDFELEFFSVLIAQCPAHVTAIKVMSNNYWAKRHYHEGLELDKRLARLRPEDPSIAYRLAAAYAVVGQVENGLDALRRALELGFDGFRLIRHDRDLDNLRRHPSFMSLLETFGATA